MLRNKEVTIFLLVVCGTAVILTGIAGLFSMQASVFVLIASVLLISISIIFTNWRYKEIEKLSGYLRQISSGNHSLDVRDNKEGELSILKNEIYKVTLMLSEHSSNLQEDKLQLTNAISDISHQLKTPLTSMMVMSDLLSNPGLADEKRKEFTHNISVQLERIEWLVSSLLKLSKIDAGTIKFKKDRINVRDLVEKAIEPMLIPLEIKEHQLTISGEDDATFKGDFNWTVEALLNIIKNCVEHTQESGQIHISFTENALYTEIMIEDNGKGIPKEDLPYIFNRFYKGKNASEESVGIGLAMAYSIITSQSGDIQVKSKVGQGTQFRIKFYKQII